MITAPDYGDLTLRAPELTFADRLTLHLSDFPVELKHVGRVHTSNDILVWLPEQKVLFSGDLAFAGGQPFLLEGSVAGFRSAIAQMRALAPSVLVPGHGPVRRGDEVGALLDNMDAYVAFVAEVAASAYAEGWGTETARVAFILVDAAFDPALTETLPGGLAGLMRGGPHRAEHDAGHP